jgi:imidazolonepropionase-like amidohydrolase
MTTRTSRPLVLAVATMVMVFPFIRVSGQMPQRAPRYAITNAKIVTAAGPAIEKGTVVMRDGVIEDVGPLVAAPSDAVIVEGSGLVVYPGLIDMSNPSLVEAPASGPAAPAPAQGGRGRGAAVATPDSITWADQEREARTRFLHPDVDAAALVDFEGDDVRRLAAAGVTSALAVPSQGIIRGQSALVNVTAPPDPQETSALATYRRGLVVVRAPVAQHVVFSTGRGGGAGEGGGGGGGYPGALLGVIAFARQSFLDAQWQKEARAFAERRKEAAAGPFEPVLDALAPALERRVPVAFDASEEREILRALAFAKEFNLDPIIVGGAEAANVIEDLKAAKARVIVSANFQAAGAGAGGRGGAGGGRGGEADTPLRITRMRQNAAKVPAALEKAGIPYAFTIGGLQNPGDFVRNVARTVREGGLPEDAAIKALTVNAAKLAGAGDRLGTIEKGRMANVIVTDGALFDTPRIRHVFVGGWPVDLEFPVQTPGGRGGRGSQ